MSVTAVRLGSSRYMRCPLCHRFATFRLDRRAKEEVPGAAMVTTPPAMVSDTSARSAAEMHRPRFDDRRTLARWVGVLVAPAIALVLVAAFVPVSTEALLLLLVASGALTLIAVILMIMFLLPDRVH
jgi:hypothetical protein